MGFSSKASACDPWVRKIHWRRAWQPTPVFLPGESQELGCLQATVHSVTKATEHAHAHTQAYTRVQAKLRNMNKISGLYQFLYPSCNSML